MPSIIHSQKCKCYEISNAITYRYVCFLILCTETRLRLYGGNNPSEGRLEIKHEGTWGTVCSDGFDQSDGQVVCSMLGYNTTYAFIEIIYVSNNYVTHISMHTIDISMLWGRKVLINKATTSTHTWGRRSRNHMIFGFTTAFTISGYHH